MKFTKDEYPILWAGISEFAETEAEALTIFKKFFLSYRTALQNYLNTSGFTEETLSKIIKANKWERLPSTEISQSPNYGDANYASHHSEWFRNLDKHQFLILAKKFSDHGIDLIFETQDNNKYYLSKGGYGLNQLDLDQHYILKSEHFITSVLSGDYLINSLEKIQLFKLVLDTTVRINVPMFHSNTLKLLLRSIELEFPQQDILTHFKTFYDVNKYFSPNVKQDYSNFIEKIKNWNLDDHFTLTEKKDLFNQNTNSIEVKQSESLHYHINLISMEIPEHKYDKYIVQTNLHRFVDVASKVLGNLDTFVKVFHKFEDPLVDVYILFDFGHSTKYKEMFSDILKEVVTSTKKIEVTYLTKYFEIRLLDAELSDNLNINKKSTSKVKI